MAPTMTAPYAPINNVLTVIHRYRDKGLPDALTMQELTRLGIPEGNAGRTLQALRMLDLIDEEGRHTDTFRTLGRAPTADYAGVLAEILKAAYADIFRIVDPATATSVQLTDAFRGYQPQKQRDRMVTLFVGLCKEAGLVEGAPPLSVPRTSPRTTPKQNTERGSSPARPPKPRQEQGMGTQQSPATSGLLFGVTEADIAALDESDFNTVWAALGKVARARSLSARQAVVPVQEDEPSATP